MSIRQETGAYTGIASAQISALGNGTGATAVAYDNGTSANLYINAGFVFSGQFGAAPNSGSALELYLLPGYNAGASTAFSDGNSAIFPPTHYAGSFIVRNVTTVQILGIDNVPLPPVPFMALLVNRAGQTLSGANFLAMKPSRFQ